MQALMGSSPLHTDRDSSVGGFLGAGFFCVQAGTGAATLNTPRLAGVNPPATEGVAGLEPATSRM